MPVQRDVADLGSNPQSWKCYSLSLNISFLISKMGNSAFLIDLA